MKDTTNEPGFSKLDMDDSFDVGLYDARVGDSQLTINLKLLAELSAFLRDRAKPSVLEAAVDGSLDQ